MGCITGFIAKLFLTACNIAVSLVGVAVLSMCAVTLSCVSSYGTAIISKDAAEVLVGLETVSLFVICLGVLGMLVACCCQNKLFLYTYFILGACLVVTVLTFGAVGNANIERYGNETYLNMYKDMETYNWTHEDPLDEVYRSHKCCGVQGPDDWKVGGDYNNGHMGEVPKGCCDDEKTEPVSKCKYGITGTDDEVYKTGCYERLEDDVKDLAMSTFGLAIFFALLLLAKIVSTCICAKCTDAMPI